MPAAAGARSWSPTPSTAITAGICARPRSGSSGRASPSCRATPRSAGCTAAPHGCTRSTATACAPAAASPAGGRRSRATPSAGFCRGPRAAPRAPRTLAARKAAAAGRTSGMSAVLLVLSSFLASAVEMVEALTIVLAAGLTRGWRSSLTGVAAAGLALAVVVAALGPALTLVPLNTLRLVVGALLLVYRRERPRLCRRSGQHARDQRGRAADAWAAAARDRGGRAAADPDPRRLLMRCPEGSLRSNALSPGTFRRRLTGLGAHGLRPSRDEPVSFDGAGWRAEWAQAMRPYGDRRTSELSGRDSRAPLPILGERGARRSAAAEDGRRKVAAAEGPSTPVRMTKEGRSSCWLGTPKAVRHPELVEGPLAAATFLRSYLVAANRNERVDEGNGMNLGMEILDRGLHDREGRRIGKIDDLILEWPDPDERPGPCPAPRSSPSSLGRWR